ncbi:PepSY-associated TM helix domain-containing protein [Herminiimonas arsenitoxidans]|uniref:PepSY-associated TM helix domain-containing protein n=1 Tax=Herminiimonas arsenitoxidans TaxID=1809410 RepID=UPI0009709B44|nr:PepSY-associated TM helix domain-containing protein [Herminiimonas arsenitoxidans]
MNADGTFRTREGKPVDLSAATSHGKHGRRRSKRAIFLTWLRKIHLYVGLWGAVFGLLFGATGLILNHRAILKIPVEKTVVTTVQLTLPHSFANPEAMSSWLQEELKFAPVAPPVLKMQPAKTVVWSGHDVQQPERWTIALNRPEGGLSAEYFVGNHYVKLDQIDATPIGTLTRLHMSIGVSAFWVLLSDTIAGSLILLSLTGLLLWTQLHTIRTIAVLTSVGALFAGLWFMWSI